MFNDLGRKQAVKVFDKLVAIVFSGVDFQRELDVLQSSSVFNRLVNSLGEDVKVSRLDLMPEFKALIDIHTKTACKVYMIYVFEFIKNLNRKEKLKYASKDVLVGLIDEKQLEQEVQKVWQSSVFLESYGVFSYAVKAKGFEGDLARNFFFIKLLNFNAIESGRLFFEKCEGVIDTFKRRLK